MLTKPATSDIWQDPTLQTLRQTQVTAKAKHLEQHYEQQVAAAGKVTHEGMRKLVHHARQSSRREENAAVVGEPAHREDTRKMIADGAIRLITRTHGKDGE